MRYIFLLLISSNALADWDARGYIPDNETSFSWAGIIGAIIGWIVIFNRKK
jgi:hypothetical protein